MSVTTAVDTRAVRMTEPTGTPNYPVSVALSDEHRRLLMALTRTETVQSAIEVLVARELHPTSLARLRGVDPGEER